MGEGGRGAGNRERKEGKGWGKDNLKLRKQEDRQATFRQYYLVRSKFMGLCYLLV